MTRCKSEGAGKEARHAVMYKPILDMYGAKEGREGGGGGGRGGGGKDAEEGAAAAASGGGGDDDDMWAEAMGKEAAILEEYGGVLSPGLGTVNVYIKWFITRWGKEIVRFHKHALHFFTDTTQHYHTTFLHVSCPPHHPVIGVLKVAMKILQTHYPELLKRTVFAHADVTFYCVFKVKEVEGRKEEG